ncbi:MAG: hypothetical protein MJH09_10185 [Cetobacterium sp.]|nr:hypothetical protein [Cetobacterium sp.]
MENEEKYIRKYSCKNCGNIIAKKNVKGETESTLTSKMRVDNKIITLICRKCGAVKILYLKNKI